MKNMKSHVYAGEDDAKLVCRWLNQKNRPAGDPVEELIKLYREIGTPLRDVPQEIRTFIGQIVVDYELAVAPTVGEVSRERWEVSWRPAWLPGVKLTPDQGLALIKVIQLAEHGFISQRSEGASIVRMNFSLASAIKVSAQNDASNATGSRRNGRKNAPSTLERYRQTVKEIEKKRKKRKWTKKDDARLEKRHSRFAADLKTKRWHG